jgi:phosphatidylinositol glycan class A protein
MISPFFSPNIGGVETHLNDLCKYLQKRGHRIFVITYQPLTTNQKAMRLEAGRSIVIRRISWLGYNLFPKLEPYPLLEFIYLTPMLFAHAFFFVLTHRDEVDVIHAHGLNAALVARFLAIVFRKKTVVSMHAIYNLDKRSLMARTVRQVLSSLDLVLTLAERSKRDLMAAGLPADKMRNYSQWVDQDKFRPLNQDQCRREVGLEGKFIVLFVGRFIAKKGINELLEVASKVDSNINFVFIGDGPLTSALRKKATLQENIVFKGKVSELDMVKYYNAADVLIIPSQYDEGFARVVLEALSCGTLVIAANKGCLPEMIDSSVGFLIDPTIKNLTVKIDELYKFNELKKLRSNCRKYAELHFNEKNAETIEKAYIKVIGDSN